MRSIGWKPLKIRPSAAWFLLIPLGLLAFAWYLYRMTGDPLAILSSHDPWGHTFSLPWQSLVSSNRYFSFITPIDRILVVVFILLAILSIIKIPNSAAPPHRAAGMSWKFFHAS
jgi:hypothetical protein